MIIELRTSKPSADIMSMLNAVSETRFINLFDRNFIAVSGDERKVDIDSLEKMPGVVRVIDTQKNPFFFASRQAKEIGTIISINNCKVGDSSIVVIGGPCAVETYEDTISTAISIKDAGVRLFRAGAFKPRTSPYNFQGLGKPGLEILARVRQETGLGIVSEVLNPEDVDLAAEYLDVIQVGARNMTNTALLKSLGRVNKPILLKRGFASTINDLLKAAEFIIYNGNPAVILCERGIMTHEPATRFTLDLSAVPVLKQLSHLPVFVDPSHATGRRDLVPIMSKCAMMAGADGLLIEVHVNPEKMIKPGDDAQALLPSEFSFLMQELAHLGQYLGRPVDNVSR
jgi:3-deoxy-7-phosphoheptulonate synthase